MDLFSAETLDKLLDSPLVQHLPLTLLYEEGLDPKDRWHQVQEKITAVDAEVQIWQAAMLLKSFFATYGDRQLVENVEFKILWDGEFPTNYFYVDGQEYPSGGIDERTDWSREENPMDEDFLDPSVARQMQEIDGFKALIAVNNRFYDFPAQRLQQVIKVVEKALCREYRSQADADEVIREYAGRVDAKITAHLMEKELASLSAKSPGIGPRF